MKIQLMAISFILLAFAVISNAQNKNLDAYGGFIDVVGKKTGFFPCRTD